MLQSSSGWEKRADSIAQIAAASAALTAAYLQQNTTQALYQGRMHLKSACAKIAAAKDAADCPGHVQLQELLQQVSDAMAALKK